MFSIMKRLIDKISNWVNDYYEIIFDYFGINNEDN